jgi:hypothetical protein
MKIRGGGYKEGSKKFKNPNMTQEILTKGGPNLRKEGAKDKLSTT